jgi:DeoR family transcriptional regulator of aga operon
MSVVHGATERRQLVLQALLREERVDVADLAQHFAVSQSTIRRDLLTLARQGLLKRQHGGASAPAQVLYEESYREKMREHSAEKLEIALAAARLIRDGEVIALSGGTTTMQIARAIKHRHGITVVTNAVNIATELANAPHLRVVVSGGTLRSPSFELVGPLAEQSLQTLNFDKAFVGVNGLTVQQGITTHNEIEALTNRAMLRQAQQAYVVADHSKLGKVAFAAIGPLSAAHFLITDAGIDPAVRAQLEATGLRVLVAEGEPLGAVRQAAPRGANGHARRER